MVSIVGIDKNWHVGQENVRFTCGARANPPAHHFTWIRSVSLKTACCICVVFCVVVLPWTFSLLDFPPVPIGDETCSQNVDLADTTEKPITIVKFHIGRYQ